MEKAIRLGNREKIEAALAEAQKRARVRLLDYADMVRILTNVEGIIYVPKKALAGTVVYYDGAQKMPNAYKGIPESTHFKAEHNGREWKIVKIWRGECPNRSDNIKTVLSEAAKEAIIKRKTYFWV